MNTRQLITCHVRLNEVYSVDQSNCTIVLAFHSHSNHIPVGYDKVTIESESVTRRRSREYLNEPGYDDCIITQSLSSGKNNSGSPSAAYTSE